MVRQNNAIDIYELYFNDMRSEVIEELPSAKTINVFKDPNPIKRTANHISWYTDGPKKIAASSCNLEFQKARSEACVDSYIWDVGMHTHTHTLALLAHTNWQMLCCCCFD